MRTGFNARRYSKPRIGVDFAKDIKSLPDRLIGIHRLARFNIDPFHCRCKKLLVLIEYKAIPRTSITKSSTLSLFYDCVSESRGCTFGDIVLRKAPLCSAKTYCTQVAR